jgi:hypothetical protein
MANVIQDTNLGDANAYYVWAAVTGPAWGTWAAFGSATMTRAQFAEEDWSAAIQAAVAEADRLGFPNVYVARNA